MSVKQNYGVGERYAMNLYESIDYFKYFFSITPELQAEERLTEDFEKAMRQLRHWRGKEIFMRTFYGKTGLLRKLKGLI